MSACLFIASDRKLESMRFEDRHGFLMTATYYDVDRYTKKKYTYNLQWEANDISYKKLYGEKLLEYIKDSVRDSGEVEIWLVWMTDYEPPKLELSKICITDLTVDMLIEFENKDLWDGLDANIPTYHCLRVRK